MKTRNAGRAFVGTSGWNYRHWADGVFYPPECRQADWLEFYSSVFDTVEINNTFYQLPDSEVFADWRDRAPEGFTFAVKANRYITHMKKLLEPEDHVKRFLSHVSELREKLGVVLFQLPPNWKFNAGRLSGLLEFIDGQTIVPQLKVAVEPRHPSWLCDECSDILRAHDAALVFADWRGCPIKEPVTADFIYVRRHGPGDPYADGYPAEAIRKDASRVRAWLADGRDAYVFYNNNAEGHAPRDAKRLRERL